MICSIKKLLSFLKIKIKPYKTFFNEDILRKVTENGKKRALEMAPSAGYSLERLVHPRQGIVQITKRNSSDIGDWDVYDTQTIDKVAKLAVTL